MSKKITDLTLLASADAADVVPLVDISASTTKKTTVAGLAAGMKTSDLALAAATATVATSQTTTSTSYTDLATTGPAATVTIGASGVALVSIYTSGAVNAASGQGWFMGFAVSGASTVAAADAFAIGVVNQDIVNNAVRLGATFLVTGLTPGSNTFTAKYKVGGAATGTFIDRKISVVPL